MERSRKSKIFLSLIFVGLMTGVGVFLFFKYSDRGVVQENVLGTKDLASVPRIISLAPMSVYEGQEYIYFVKVTDNDTDSENIVIGITEGPDWLVMKDGKIYGTAPLGSSGTYKFVLRVSDGENSSLQESYILVEKSNE